MDHGETAADMVGATTGCPHLPGYDPLSPGELNDPYPSFERARREAPVFYSEELDMWSVARQADVLAILRDLENFSSRAALPVAPPPAEIRDRMPEYPWAHTLLLMDDPDHKPARAVIQAPFTPRSIRALEAGMRQRASDLLRPLTETGRIEFVRQYGYPLSLWVIGEILGVPEERFDLLARAVDGTFRLLGGAALSAEETLVAASTIADLCDYMYELVEARRASPKDDFTSVMVHTPLPDGSLETTANLVTHVWVIIGAGFETSANQLALGVRALLSHPDQWQLLLAEPTLVDNAVEEMLRYRTFIKRMYRVAKRDVTIAGVTIPEGARVALLAASANRDEDAYADDPNQFDVRRRREHLAFGKWKHFCVGAPLARLEMKIALQAMLEACPRVTIAGNQEVAWRRDLRADALSGLYLEVPSAPDWPTGPPRELTAAR
jgi:cytochrome P450